MAFTSPSSVWAFDRWLNRKIAHPAIQDRVARLPVLRRFARRDGRAIFDLVQGFVRSQTLFALVELEILERLIDGARSADDLALATGMDAQPMGLLLQAGAGTGVLKRRRDGRFALTRQGAALIGVPGLREMILHHRAFYSDMADPVALLRGEVETKLAAFWPYVFGAEGAVDPAISRRYSDLMADSQRMVASDTLQTVSLSGIERLVDIGGGSGAFLLAVAEAYPDIDLALFDLPSVMPAARERVDNAGLGQRIALIGASFRDDPLPEGADAVSLVRVLYDHGDETVAALLRKIFASLPRGGRLIVSEPMSGGDAPDSVTDVYFAFYTLAMRTGRTRSADEIKALISAAGFADIKAYRPRRSYVTAVITAVKPE